MEKKFVGILSTCSLGVDPYYGSVARSVAVWLNQFEYNLIFGGCSQGATGVIYYVFSKNNRMIYVCTTKKYEDDARLMENAKTIVCETTFDVKKKIFENSDLIVVLPGGIGTLSEFFSFIEENRSNDRNVPIEIYDEDNFFKPIIERLKVLIANDFVSSEILESFKISHNKEEFIDHLYEYEKERGKRYER